MESGLPPILNALEYYLLEQFTDSATDPSDGTILFDNEVVNNTIASNKEGFLKSKNQPFTYSEIVTITANFETGIGEGGFGKVFRGHLNNGTSVAVKLLSSSSKQGCKEFQAEEQSLMIVHHKNLVSLIGYCKEDDHMALIYEFMSNGNLRQHLFCIDDEVKECIGRNDENVQSEMTSLELASNSYTLPKAR
ncbi:hypothetical protein GOBAR_AA32760 [Gossypium barbadense]|uniref:Protein kinase domain-containing protein n=1 Tax=Gossypium barbadense TaxID=3634 RepID=A0A2P5WA42_GOSBA|nr:hypothetical protein GOBAR_AA32760 [Gossypium barbadense]